MDPITEATLIGFGGELHKSGAAEKIARIGKLVTPARALAAGGLAATGVASGVAVKKHKAMKQEQQKKNALIRYMIMQRLRSAAGQ